MAGHQQLTAASEPKATRVPSGDTPAAWNQQFMVGGSTNGRSPFRSRSGSRRSQRRTSREAVTSPVPSGRKARS